MADGSDWDDDFDDLLDDLDNMDDNAAKKKEAQKPEPTPAKEPPAAPAKAAVKPAPAPAPAADAAARRKRDPGKPNPLKGGGRKKAVDLLADDDAFLSGAAPLKAAAKPAATSPVGRKRLPHP